MSLAGMTQEQTDRENREHCQRIAEEIAAYTDGRVFRCPHCDGVFPIEDGHKCPHCGEEIDDGDAEQMSVYDYFEDVYDIEYRISGNGEYRSVCIMVACGGPNIYIDTASGDVELYWWGDRARYPLSSAARDEIDSYFEELYQCSK